VYPIGQGELDSPLQGHLSPLYNTEASNLRIVLIAHKLWYKADLYVTCNTYMCTLDLDHESFHPGGIKDYPFWLFFNNIFGHSIWKDFPSASKSIALAGNAVQQVPQCITLTYVASPTCRIMDDTLCFIFRCLQNDFMAIPPPGAALKSRDSVLVAKSLGMFLSPHEVDQLPPLQWIFPPAS
jgi:hypothetical protein